MISKYRKSLKRHLVDLRLFEASPNDLSLLKELQADLYRTICRAEKAKQGLKASISDSKAKKRHGRLTKAASASLKARINILETHVGEYEKTLTLLRSLGDGIAFTLFDKWDLKPLHFKEDSGHLHGKAGVKLERKILNAMLNRGVTAVHCDITNVLRYGDICVRIESFPFLIEVKSSKNTNDRVERQLEGIRKLHQYYGTDEIEGLYGVPKITRASPSMREVEYSAELNELISRSKGTKCVWKTVEPGLVYAILRSHDETSLDQILNGMERPVLGIVNQDKFTGVWSSYRPYTVTIRDIDNLLEFIYGDFTILVVYDDSMVVEHAKRRGYNAELVEQTIDPLPKFISSGQLMYSFTKLDAVPGDEPRPMFYSSYHFMGRSQFEFVSMKWLVDASIDNINDSLERIGEWTECVLKSGGG